MQPETAPPVSFREERPIQRPSEQAHSLMQNQQRLQHSMVTREQRLRSMLQSHHKTIWRMVRRLGVPMAHCDDASQQVFLVAAEKLDEIKPESEKSFLLGTAIRVASNMRRLAHVQQERADDDAGAQCADPAPLADVLIDQKRMRELLDQVLDSLDEELRAVFVLAEIEGTTAAEIADILSIPAGTVASRLRRARESFQSSASRLRAKLAHGGTKQ